MTATKRSIILAVATLMLALAGALGFFPKSLAQFLPIGMMVFLPWALRGDEGRCGAV